MDKAGQPFDWDHAVQFRGPHRALEDTFQACIDVYTKRRDELVASGVNAESTALVNALSRMIRRLQIGYQSVALTQGEDGLERLRLQTFEEVFNLKKEMEELLRAVPSQGQASASQPAIAGSSQAQTPTPQTAPVAPVQEVDMEDLATGGTLELTNAERQSQEEASSERAEHKRKWISASETLRGVSEQFKGLIVKGANARAQELGWTAQVSVNTGGAILVSQLTDAHEVAMDLMAKALDEGEKLYSTFKADLKTADVATYDTIVIDFAGQMRDLASNLVAKLGIMVHPATLLKVQEARELLAERVTRPQLMLEDKRSVREGSLESVD